MKTALLSLTLPALLALAACGPDAYEGTKDAPDTCELCTDGGTGGGSILSNPTQVTAGNSQTCAVADSGVPSPAAESTMLQRVVGKRRPSGIGAVWVESNSLMATALVYRVRIPIPILSSALAREADSLG